MIFRIFVIAIFTVACYFLYQVYGYRYVLSDIRDTAPAATIMGPEFAPINIVAYLDYGSSWSRRAHPLLLQLLSENPDVNLIVKPYSGLAENSEYGARLAFAALQDNNFLDVHGILMDAPEGLPRDYIKKVVQLRGMRYETLEDRLNDPVVNDMIDDIKKEALFLGIDTTPQIYIEDVVLTGGGRTFREMEDIIRDVRSGRK